MLACDKRVDGCSGSGESMESSVGVVSELSSRAPQSYRLLAGGFSHNLAQMELMPVAGEHT